MTVGELKIILELNSFDDDKEIICFSMDHHEVFEVVSVSDNNGCPQLNIF